MKLSTLYTTHNPALKSKPGKRVSQHRISRQRLHECLGSSDHSYGAIPISLYGAYCWGHSPEFTNQNYIFIMSPKVCQWRLARSETPYLEQGPCIPPSRFRPSRRSGLQLRVNLELVTAWRICGRSTGIGSRFENYIRVWSAEDVKLKISSHNRD